MFVNVKGWANMRTHHDLTGTLYIIEYFTLLWICWTVSVSVWAARGSRIPSSLQLFWPILLHSVMSNTELLNLQVITSVNFFSVIILHLKKLCPNANFLML